MASKSVNVVLLGGTVLSPPKQTDDEINFALENITENESGIMVNNKFFCKITGDKAKLLSGLKEGNKIVVEGKMRTNPITKIKYVHVNNFDV